MLNESDLSEDQQAAIDRLYNFDQTYLIAPTGAGKTVVLLTAIAELIRSGDLSRVLVIAPLKVVETAWKSEATKWDHLKGLRIAYAIGTPEEREDAVYSSSDIVVTNEENAASLFKNYDLGSFKRSYSFNGIAIDEIGKWSDTGGQRFKALRNKMKHFRWRVGMTASPVGEGLLMLFGQILLLDLGERFGKSRDRFKRKYFYPTDWDQYDWEILPGQEAKLIGKIRDMTHVMPDYKHELPPKTVHVCPIEIGDEGRRIYNRMRIDSVLKLDLPPHPIVKAPNQGVLSGKLEQLANGFLYYFLSHKETDSSRQILLSHSAKEDWLDQRICDLVVGRGESVIVVYWFEADAIWLRMMFPEALELKGDVSAIMEKWRTRTGQIMLLHPASAGHGVDGLQDTCSHQLWLSPTWSRDKKQQTEDRLWRRGQTRPVTIEICVARGTIDEVKQAAVEGKGEYDDLLHEHLKA